MKKEQGAIVDRRGNAIGTISVTVYNTGTAVKPTLYSDNGITPQNNPFNCDSMGRWAFYVANSRIDIEFAGAMINTYKMVDVLVEDAAAVDATSIRGHTVDETDLGNDKILVYKTTGNKFVYEAKGTPSAHAASHQDVGGDEIIVTGLSGLLADGQTPLAHKTSHQDGGGDEISVAGLSGALADKQDANKIQGHTVDEVAVGDDKVLVYKITGDKFVYEAKTTPGAHAASHQDGGGDEISVAGLSGLLADKQDASKIQGHVVDETAIANDRILVYKTSGDKFMYEAKGTPSAHAVSHQDGGGDEISVAGLSGVLADKQNADKIQGHTVDEAAVGDDKVLVYKTTGNKFIYEAKGAPSAHAASHQAGGGDVLNLSGLVGVPLWVDVRSYADINAAVAAIGATPAILLVPNTQILSASLTIPSTLILIVSRGGLITKASTYTVTCNSPLEAGPYQIFSGFSAGNVTFGPGAGKKVHPEWWGENTTPGTTDMLASLQSAIDSITTNGGEIEYRNYIYFVSSTVSGKSNVTIKGTGSKSAMKLAAAANLPCLALSGATAVRLRNFKIDGNGINQTGGANTDGILINSSSSDIDVEGVEITDCWGHGILVSGSSSDVRIKKSHIHNTGHLAGHTSRGIYVYQSSKVTIDDDNNIHDVDGFGITIQESPNCKVDGNAIDNTTTYDGIQLYNSDHAIITNNTVQDSGDTGIVLEISDHCVVTGNTVERSGVDGIVNAGGKYNIIFGNPVKDSSQNANNTYYGIRLTSDSATGLVYSTDNIVKGNTIVDTAANKAKYSIIEVNAGDINNIILGNVTIGAVTGTVSLNSGTGISVDRGDPAANDWSLANFTTDGTWRDLDCSGIVPAGVKFIFLKIRIQSTTVSAALSLRKNGNSNDKNSFGCACQASGALNNNQGMVACDKARVIEYNASNITWTTMTLTVLGWQF